ncbi:MAG: lipoyl synthase [Acidobacteria bacterium]|nr:lipoyl synthase [Acidobacteriota bacterium]MBV9475193.1 lipoyl synthase [Acidobacteriota bacterium]
MSSQRLPPWIREKKLNLASLREVKTMLRERDLHSVCESLACPNRTECFSRGTATFMILGDICTRSCGFCNVTTGRPYAPPSPAEPRAVAETARRLGLKHVVVTSVTRDDLDDGGAQQFAETIHELRALLPHAAVEVLTSDFRGNLDAVRIVVEARPDYFNHNVETVPRLYDYVRPGSRFERSLAVLREAKAIDPTIATKSGLMLGLGERRDEVVEALQRLRESHVEIVTIGQYLQPKREKLDVVEYVHPAVFEEYREIGEELGFRAVFSGPFVRSSYMADLVAHEHAQAAGN